MSVTESSGDPGTGFPAELEEVIVSWRVASRSQYADSAIPPRAN